MRSQGVRTHKTWAPSKATASCLMSLKDLQGLRRDADLVAMANDHRRLFMGHKVQTAARRSSGRKAGWLFCYLCAYRSRAPHDGDMARHLFMHWCEPRRLLYTLRRLLPVWPASVPLPSDAQSWIIAWDGLQEHGLFDATCVASWEQVLWLGDLAESVGAIVVFLSQWVDLYDLPVGNALYTQTARGKDG